ncbi:uncharacterized protein LOC106177529 [Lingula anatina]|uniref:Uncharacterized protein LOC106177529 n=1 Tax=Lingula anatina TaxID=7574 RepID=A0A1S3K0H8_LINAN|nr:uncharacterized protein LOC106177529 [Lingula anatina]|eukprot:XP_013415786.1 uncharacterized protein LOC106177529 [Lingula anatina]
MLTLPSGRKARMGFRTRPTYNEVPKTPKTPPPPSLPEPPLPLTVDSVRRKVLLALHDVQRQLIAFRKTWLRKLDTDASPKWLDFYNLLLFKCSLKTDTKTGTLSVEQFANILYTENHDNEKIQQQFGTDPTLEELKQTCNRDSAFRDFRTRIQKKMKDSVFFHLEKCCVSFVEETHSSDLSPVKEYEDEIVAFKVKFHETLEHVDALNKELEELRASMPLLLEEYDKVAHYMEGTIEEFLNICHPARRLLESDEGYSRRLQNEIIRLNYERLRFKEEIKHINNRKDTVTIRATRRSYSAKQAEIKVQEKLEEQTTFRRRQLTARENFGRLDNSLLKKKRKLQDLQRQIKDYRAMMPPNSPVLREAMKAEKITYEEVQSLQRRMDKLNGEVNALKNEKLGSYVQLFELERQSQQHRSSEKAAFTILGRHKRTLSQVRSDLKDNERKLRILLKIKELKHQPESMEKMYKRPEKGETIEMKAYDYVHEAIKFVAAEIGQEWPELYMDLPFSPRRDFHCKARDIEVIDANTYGVTVGWQEKAIKSLERWRRFSRLADVNELILTLKRLKKMDLVRRLETHMLKISVNGL